MITLRLALTIALILLCPPSMAEVAEINLANQHGFGHLTLTTVKGERLIEKHAAAGLSLKPRG